VTAVSCVRIQSEVSTVTVEVATTVIQSQSLVKVKIIQIHPDAPTESTKSYFPDHFLDVNECQTGQHSCSASQRCDNSPGSYSCIRITGCGTGYTLNSGTGQCEGIHGV